MRTITPPPEWQVTCDRCSAVLAYTRKDVEHSRPLLTDYIVCPHCESDIYIPSDESHRRAVEKAES